MATYRWTLLRAGEFRLDGGSMFGLVPRVVWSRTVPVDDRGRITVQHNCLLLERHDAGPGPRRILIEAGTGDKLDAKMRDVFALENRTVVDALGEVGVKPDQIEAAIVSHLHFDHAGGLTRRCREGETPDWTEGESRVKVTFPSARVISQSREWSDAIANRSVMTRTYYRDHLEPIRDRLMLVDSPRPFPVGRIPDRDELPRIPQEARETEALPGIFVFLAPGHTWGQQAVRFVDDLGRHVVFTPDVMPTVRHLGAAYSLGYDVEPYTSMITRRWFLEEASERGWMLVLDHEPGNPCQTVIRADRGWYELRPVEAPGPVAASPESGGRGETRV